MVILSEHPAPSRDSRQPFADSEHLAELPDQLTASEHDTYVVLQNEYLRLRTANEAFNAANFHAYADEIREKMVLDPEGAPDLAASLVAERQGFSALRLAAKERCRRHSVGKIAPFVLPILKRSLAPIQERIDLIDQDYSGHWERTSGACCHRESPVANGLRALKNDIESRIIDLEKVIRNPKEYWMSGAGRQLRGLIRWAPSASTEEGAE
tara:strand:- start:895 stop:1527 length:633 start_codon:yes stop_codon:yes gene_type:complete